MTTNKPNRLLPSLWAIHPDELVKVEHAYTGFLEKDFKVQGGLLEIDISNHILIIYYLLRPYNLRL